MFIFLVCFWGTFLESWRHTPVSDPPRDGAACPTLWRNTLIGVLTKGALFVNFSSIATELNVPRDDFWN